MNHILSLELRGPQHVTAMLLLLDMRLWFGTVGRSLRLPCEVCLFRSFIHSFISLPSYHQSQDAQPPDEGAVVDRWPLLLELKPGLSPRNSHLEVTDQIRA